MNQLYSFSTALLLFAGLLLTPSLHGQTFGNEIQIPSTIENATIELAVDATVHDFDPNMTDSSTVSGGTYFFKNGVSTFSYNPQGTEDMTYLGPTLIWNHGENQATNVVNNLTERTTVHWHGAHIPAKDDGGPHQPIDFNGGLWAIDFEIMDDVTSLWYHPHLEDSTFIQVELGLSGLIIIEDVNDTLRDDLPHTYGVDDIPLIVQDKQFVFDSAAASFSIKTTQNSGPDVVVNGVINPYMEAYPQMMRFRVLDGSSRQFYLIGIQDDQGNKVPFWLTGSDAGYLDAPIMVDSFATGPGIRNEFVVDFSSYAGQNLYMYNYAADLSDAWPGKVTLNRGNQPAVNEAIMEIRVGLNPTFNPVLTPPPSQFPTYPTFDTSAVSVVRPMRLQGQSGGADFSINGNQFILEHINDTIKLDSTEMWQVINESNAAHPFHIHDVHVDVVAVYDSNGTEITPVPAEFMGRQDNMLVPAGWQVDFVTTFEDFGDTLWMGDPERTAQSGYMYHCHILTHEDGYYAGTDSLSPHGMMQQFLVWNGVTILTDVPESVENFGDILFYPNPATDVLHLQGESKRASLFCLYDLSGKRIVRQEMPPFNGIKSFDVSSVPQGMYLVEWTDQNKRTYTHRIAFQR